MRTTAIRLLATTALALSTGALGAGQSSANYRIPADVLNNGVGDMSSASYRLSASLGDAVFTGLLASTSFKLSSGFRAEISASAAVLGLLTVVSRKVHGATPFSLAIDKSQLLSGNVTVEPRAIGGGHTLVFSFDHPVTSVAALAALLNSAGTATAAVVNNNVEVTLTNVADNTRLTITLSGLNGSGTASASLGFLVGDVNSSHAVNAADISAVKANLGKTADGITYKFDLNATGSITPSDVSAVKARSGLVLPP